jgi:hypothetical protein
METPLVNKKYLLERFQAKGGWTYAAIPEILQDKNSPFGWVKVRGTIDGYEIKNYHLMPMGNGKLFLPVKATIRKVIKKKEGDYVHVILYPDNAPLEVPEELLNCLKDEPKAYQNFLDYSDGEKKAFVEWVYSAKKEETKAERIVKMIQMLIKKQSIFKNKQQPD